MLTYSEHPLHAPSGFRPLGKTFLPAEGELALPWCDSGFAFRFAGSGFFLNLGPYADPQPAYLRVWTDGVPQRFAVANGNEKLIVEGLPEGVHTVRVLRVTEGNVSVRVASAVLFGESPALLDPPAEKPLRLTFIGDSITCGYGVVGPSTSVGYSVHEQDSSRSYAYRTAELLDAEILLAGASGKGVVANCNGDRSDLTLRQAFQRETPTGGQWDHSRRIPDLTVINAGTNDAWGGVTDAEFLPAALSLLREVRAAYPGKPIVWCYGVMDQSKCGAVRQAVETFDREAGQAYYLQVDSMYQIPGETGGGGHPNVNTSVRVSALLAMEIRRILGR